MRLDLHSPVWTRALTVRERIDIARGLCRRVLDVEINAAVARRRTELWLPVSPASDITEGALLTALGLPTPRLLEALVPPPPWLETLLAAYGRGAAAPERRPQRGWRPDLSALVEPLLAWADAELDQAERREETPIRDSLRHALATRLVALALRTLVLELHSARLRGELKGQTPEQRYQDFVARLARPRARKDLLEQYPVLARDLAIASRQWVTFASEFLGRLSRDRTAIRAAFNLDDLGPAVEIVPECGDRHRNGRSASRVRFANGVTLMYKPRALAVDAAFGRVIGWLNDHGAEPSLASLHVLDRGTHGWMAFVEPEQCSDLEEPRRYYRRLGALACVCTTFRLVDIHFENVIARRDHPLILDFEAAMQPVRQPIGPQNARRAAERLLTTTVLACGLFPASREQAERGYVSGVESLADSTLPDTALRIENAGSDNMRFSREQRPLPASANVPRLNGVPARAADFVDDITDGFASMYRLIAKHRSELMAPNGPLSWFQGLEIRVVMRHTRTYQLLLTELLHPAYLADTLERGRALESLFEGVLGDTRLRPVVEAEIAALERGDVPFFTSCPEGRQLAGEGRVIPAFFDECGTTAAERQLTEMSDANLATELWLIRSSMATLHRGPTGKREHEIMRPREVTIDFLEQAAAIGNRLVATAIRGAGDLTWLGVQADVSGRWAIRPLSHDLYDGLPGVVLFLASLGRLTEEKRFTAYARGALAALESAIVSGELAAARNGAYTGLGGLIFLYLHLSSLWNDRRLQNTAEKLIEQVAATIERDDMCDVMSGSAGCILVLSSFYRTHPSPYITAAITRLAEHLLAHAVQTPTGLAWHNKHHRALSGLSHGAAGCAWALAEAAAITDHERFLRGALDGQRFEQSLYSPEMGGWRDAVSWTERAPIVAWCNGAPGIALTRARIRELFPHGAISDYENAALQATAAAVDDDSDCLCHGAMGRIDVLLQTTKHLHAIPRMLPAPGAWRCGTPLGVESPGLMTGLAGIGYQYLRLHDPKRVPSVLAVEPPRYA